MADTVGTRYLGTQNKRDLFMRYGVPVIVLLIALLCLMTSSPSASSPSSVSSSEATSLAVLNKQQDIAMDKQRLRDIDAGIETHGMTDEELKAEKEHVTDRISRQEDELRHLESTR